MLNEEKRQTKIQPILQQFDTSETTATEKKIKFNNLEQTSFIGKNKKNFYEYF